MSEQRLSLWNAEEDLEEVVDLSLAIENYGPNVYDDGLPTGFFFSYLKKIKYELVVCQCISNHLRSMNLLLLCSSI